MHDLIPYAVKEDDHSVSSFIALAFLLAMLKVVYHEIHHWIGIIMAAA